MGNGREGGGKKGFGKGRDRRQAHARVGVAQQLRHAPVLVFERKNLRSRMGA